MSIGFVSASDVLEDSNFSNVNVMDDGSSIDSIDDGSLVPESNVNVMDEDLMSGSDDKDNLTMQIIRKSWMRVFNLVPKRFQQRLL